MRGKLKGEWVDARARLLQDEEDTRAHRLLDKKYGLLKKIGNVYSRIMKRQRVGIAIEVDA